MNFCFVVLTGICSSYLHFTHFFVSFVFRFAQYLSIGNDLGKIPVTYTYLKVIELYQVIFEDMKEILVVLRLIMNSPNLEELQISVSHILILPVTKNVTCLQLYTFGVFSYFEYLNHLTPFDCTGLIKHTGSIRSS